MIRELELLSRTLKNSDVTLLRCDLDLLQKDLAREGAKFIKSISDQSRKEKKSSVILLAIVHS